MGFVSKSVSDCRNNIEMILAVSHIYVLNWGAPNLSTTPLEQGIQEKLPPSLWMFPEENYASLGKSNSVQDCLSWDTLI
jgi:hypothetical protein